MAQENVQFSTANMCLSPRSADEFCNINNSTGIFRIVTSLGVTILNATMDTAVSEIQCLEYVGPRSTGGTINQMGNKLPFYTLEHISSSQCYIREWWLDGPNAQFKLKNTLNITTSGSNYFDCYDMAVEHYITSFSGSVTSGTGLIYLNSYYNLLEVGDKLLLGPSGDVTNLYAYEWVNVTYVDGNAISISSTTSGITACQYEYAGGDDISFSKHVYLFSDVGQNNDTSKGALYKLTIASGVVESVGNSGVFSGIRAAAWSSDYQMPGFVKGTNLYYVEPTNYLVQKSHALNNIESDKSAVIPIYDLVFNANTIYRLQLKKTLVDDSGTRTTYSWATYNYHQDVINFYTKSIDVETYPDGVVLNDESVALYCTVRDQYGVGLTGKTMTFSKSSGDTGGYFTPLDGIVYTNSSGVAQISYHTGYYDPTAGGSNTEDIIIKIKTDGASTYTGSTFVWDGITLPFYKKFSIDLNNITQKPTWSGGMPTIGSDLYTQAYLKQVNDTTEMTNFMYIPSLSKFQFPGGDWSVTGAPINNTTMIAQLANFPAIGMFSQINRQESVDLRFVQLKQQSNSGEISQLYVSKHTSTGHKDTALVDQFQFIQDAIPAFWSLKNAVNTNIWIRLRPYAFSLNQSTVVFEVRELSYAGDTGYVNVTSSCVITTFDAGGGLLGIDILYNPSVDFHYNSIVYVRIAVYDTAPAPNIIVIDYWFKVIADYKMPYITNEFPAREEEDVDVGTSISFDIYDIGVGVDISTLEFFVNNRLEYPTYSGTSDGYHVTYTPDIPFNYGETITVSVKITDLSSIKNTLYDAWRFYCEGSSGPWIDPDSFYPKNCTKGVYRKLTGVSANVYGVDGTGVDYDSILFEVGGKQRNVRITPIIYRID